MYTECWWEKSSVIDQLFECPTAFEYVQTTRLLRHKPYSSTVKYWADQFNFKTNLNLDFPKTQLKSLKTHNCRIEITNLMLGLTGNLGVLPFVYTQKIRQAPRKKRDEIHAFLDLFNHKLNAQYIDASLCLHLPIRYEIEEDNLYLDILHNLTGYIRSQHEQYTLDDYFAEFSGLMQGQSNSAYSLKTIIMAIFKVHAEIKEFKAERFELAPEQRVALGETALLGVNSFCGSKLTQLEGKIEIIIGPLSHQQYQLFLPQQTLSLQLQKLLMSWCTPSLLIDVRLILEKKAISPLRLNSSHCSGLGQMSFVADQSERDRQDLCYGLIKEDLA